MTAAMRSTPARSVASWAGHRPSVSRQGLAQTVDWYLANPDWVRRVQDGGYHGPATGTIGVIQSQPQGNRTGGWCGHATASDHTGYQQAAAADLRQADDLLPAQRADAGRYPRSPGHQHTRRSSSSSSGCWATEASGACTSSTRYSRAPDGLPQALVIAKEFLGGGPSCLVLGDNIFYGQGFTPMLRRADERAGGTTIFGYRVKNPDRASASSSSTATSGCSALEEKPAKPEVESCGDRAVLLRRAGTRRTPLG